MQQQGIEVENIKESDTTKSNERKEKLQKTYDDIEERIDDIDLGDLIPENKEEPKARQEVRQDVYEDPNHPMYNKRKNAEVERVLIEHCRALSQAFDQRFPLSEIKEIESAYARFWYNYIATEGDKLRVRESRKAYIGLSIPPLGTFSLNKYHAKKSSFLFRFIFFWTLIPTFISLYEGLKVLVGNDEDYVAGEGIDLFFNDIAWANLVTWYELNKMKNKNKVSIGTCTFFE